MEKLKVPKRAKVTKVNFHGGKKKSGHPENPYWSMFDQKMVRAFNYNPKICNFIEGQEVKAVIGRWRPTPKDWVPILYVPMYAPLRRDFAKQQYFSIKNLFLALWTKKSTSLLLDYFLD